MSGTKRFVEQRILKNRRQEAKETDLRRMLVENNILAGHAKSEFTVENKRRGRQAATEQHELFMDYTYKTAQQDEERRTRMSQFEENIADELAKRKAEQLREEMHKRRVCDGSEELRILKERLHAAKVNKERAQQLLDLEVRKEGDRLHDHRIAGHMENERVAQVEMEHKLNAEKLKQKERVKAINQNQIAQKEIERQDALKEYLKEKAAVKLLADQIAKEDTEEKSAREEKKKEAQDMMRAFMVEQKAKQQEAERQEKEENDRIEQYAQDKRMREQAVIEEQQKVAAAKAEVLKAQLGAAEQRNKELQEQEQLRNDLHLETAEAEHRRREELVTRKRLEDKEEMKRAYLFQMRLKEERRANNEAEEARIKESLMRKFAEDDRIEQMNGHRRRMKLEEHKRETHRLIALRKQMFEASRNQERADDENVRAEEVQRQMIIEAERRRLLTEYGVPLKDFLPKHTCETDEDFKTVFSDIGYPVAVM